MRWNPKLGTLDRQAGFLRVALRVSIARTPANTLSTPFLYYRPTKSKMFVFSLTLVSMALNRILWYLSNSRKLRYSVAGSSALDIPRQAAAHRFINGGIQSIDPQS